MSTTRNVTHHDVDGVPPSDTHNQPSANQPPPAPDSLNVSGQEGTATTPSDDRSGEDDLEEFSLDDIEIIESKVFA
jgi:hypothetical protein